ncbi:MAG: hypothetical protein K6T88_00475 [Bacillus sp. (in: Bacteria)]|nr:hypothetical protein [Bacillus sp. (in: firmicutes)]
MKSFFDFLSVTDSTPVFEIIVDSLLIFIKTTVLKAIAFGTVVFYRKYFFQ